MSNISENCGDIGKKIIKFTIGETQLVDKVPN